jgi:glyoxylase-like metal-dependent hydrolase (beta-lactamase superfamily II)
MKQYLFLFAFILCVQQSLAQKPHYDVYAIRFASSALPFTAADWSDKAPTTDSVKIDFMVWLIKGDNGKNILFDAGFYNDLEDAAEFRVINYTRPDSVLSKLAVKPGDITDVVLSHPHWDHIDGVDLFPNAQVWMQKEDFNYFVSTAWQKGNSHGGFKPRDVKKLIDLNLAGKLTLVDGDDKEIIPGISVYTGSRHTYNSQYVGVETGNNKIILASDNIWIYYSLEHLVPPSQGGTLDPDGYVKAMQRMKTMVKDAKFIIPGHDSRVLERFPKKAEGVVRIE